MTDEVVNDDVDDLFEGEDHKEIETEVIQDEPETKDDPPQGEVKDETPEPLESEPPAEEKPALVPKAAVLDERRKRQQLEEEVKQLREQIPKSEEAPDPYDDIDAYNAFMKSQWEREQYDSQESTRFKNIEQSRSVMLEKHDDFNEMERIFELMIAADPSLAEKRMSSGDEPLFAYESAKAYKESLLGTVTEKPSSAEDALKAAINAPNLASATAQGSNTPPIEKEEGLMDIFGDQAY